MDLSRVRIVDCEAKDPYKVWIKFVDGVEGTVDLSDLLEKKVFSNAWSSEEKFKLVRIDPETETLTWGHGQNAVDINPISLKEEVLRSKQD